MGDYVKLVKVDNWGIYFLQRLKHFFNRTDYCDLTLQFQDNAQLKVHRLVLSACTEYFELLERTCEMYEDCLVMPDDLQADVVVPIVNFMYTGQLEFKMELLESLHQTSQIMNMPVLTKLLDAHRAQQPPKQFVSYSNVKRSYAKPSEQARIKHTASSSPASTSNKRSYSKAFGAAVPVPAKETRQSVRNEQPIKLVAEPVGPPSPNLYSTRQSHLSEPRPTRYELPEELDTDNIFDESFSNISYTSQPLMVHPEATKHYPAKKSGLFSQASGSKKLGRTVDIVEYKKARNDNIFDDDLGSGAVDDSDLYKSGHFIKDEPMKSSNQIFDQIIDQQDGPKVTIETKDSNQASNIDHAKIISEVLKKYPHLVKSNKNIKLKILDTPATKTFSSKQKQQSKYGRRKSQSPSQHIDEKFKSNDDFTYETEVLDSKEAAKLISMGADNIKGPWICLICGTPGKALHFTSYYKFRRHLVEVHNEKPISKMCEYCGLKSLKRNYLLHHLYTKHGVEPPPSYHFPKCNICDYVALTQGFLAKHKMTHPIETKNYRCNVCPEAFHTSAQLLYHIQVTGHKYSAERKVNLQCIYCQKVFLRESNLYAHLKTNHKAAAKADGIIDESDEERMDEEKVETKVNVKYELEDDDGDSQYQIQHRPDGNIHLIHKKQTPLAVTPTKQKILNSGLTVSPPSRKQAQPKTLKPNIASKPANIHIELTQEITPQRNSTEEIVVIDNNEYIMKDNQLIPRKKVVDNDEFIISDMITNEDHTMTTATMDYAEIHDADEGLDAAKVINKAANINKPIQFVVSNEEEYKALMNSNHSIIFNDGDTNKTLTVLSTPHSANIGSTTMDLDNTHTNDMMIIQENYPLTVSEALPGDNSNIVVVYSHVNPQNKQYQLISQDIGAQFVQTSAVISQNYETITTSSPGMNAHVIDTQVETSWPSNLNSNIIPTQDTEVTVAQLQEMSVVEDATIVTPVVATGDLSELPEVTLTPQSEATGTESQVEDNTDTAEEHLRSIRDGVEMATSVNFEKVDTPVHAETTIENADIIVSNSQNELQDESLNNVEVQQAEGEFCIIEEGIEEENDLEEEKDEGPILDERSEEQMEEPSEHNQTQNTEGIEMIGQIATNTEVDVQEPKDNPTNEVVKEQIQTLASEWSEEDDESTNTEPQSKVDNNTPNTESDDIEESIENIQQEMEKQITDTVEQDGDKKEENMETAPSDNLNNLQKESEGSSKPAQEKISSLLNDWEDNDSQEENDHTNENEEVEEGSSLIVAAEDNGVDNNEGTVPTNDAGDNDLQVDKDKPAKDNTDKIKTLVSDWDDEDDEVRA